jgi:Protein of unknown function (DUF4242)
MVEPSEKHGLSLFLAERYVSSANPELAHLDAARASAASKEPTESGETIRYLGSTLIPSDETCLVLFEAPTAEEVRRLLERASLPYDRIFEAIRVDTEKRDDEVEER